MRSTIDKDTIKHLFVGNIGKYFKADRIFFSDYDEISNIYLPIDKNSEYLSSKNEKSFVGIDWSNAIFKDHIKPLLEKRESFIENWDEYLKKNENNQGFVDFFKDSNTKSSYNIPVIYQQRLLGYFGIEFTQKSCELTTEEINSIRNMCTQCGIALYHAELYIMAKELAKSKNEFITKMSHELKMPLNTLTGFSEILYESELEHDKHVEYLETINNSAKQVLDLTNYIITISKLKP